MRYGLLRVGSRHGPLVWHAALMSGVVLAMDWLVVAVREDSDSCVGACLLQARLDGRTMKSTRSILAFLLQECTCALTTMMAATPLFFSNGGEVRRILLSVVIIDIARLCPLFGFA
jgi:hypothetical protein